MAKQEDPFGAMKLHELRLSEGLSPEALAREMKSRCECGSGDCKHYVTGQTVRDIEDTYRVPNAFTQYLLAKFFRLLPHDIWRTPAKPRKLTRA